MSTHGQPPDLTPVPPAAGLRPLIPILLVLFIDMLGTTMIMPLVALYAERFSAPPVIAVLVFPVYSICQLVAGPVLGRLSDRYGRKPVLLFSQLGSLAGFLMMADAHALWMVFAARMIDGVTAGNAVLAQAYVADVSRPEERTKAFGYVGIAVAFSYLLGPLTSAYLVRHGLAAPMWAAAALSAASILCTFVLLPNGRPLGAHLAVDRTAVAPHRALAWWKFYADLLRRPGLGATLLQLFCYFLAFAIHYGGLALFAERRLRASGTLFGAREISLLLAYIGLLGIVLHGALTGRLSRRFGDRRLSLAGFGSVIVAYAMYGLTEGGWSLAVAATCSAFGHGILRVTLGARLTRHAAANEQGTVLGMLQSAQCVAAIIAALVPGFLIQGGHFTAWALVPIVPATFAAWIEIRSSKVSSRGTSSTRTG